MQKQMVPLGIGLLLLAGVIYSTYYAPQTSIKLSGSPVRPFTDGFNCAFLRHERERLLLSDPAYQEGVVETLEGLYKHELDRFLERNVNVSQPAYTRKGTHYYEWLAVEPYFGWIYYHGHGDENKLTDVGAYVVESTKINDIEMNPNPPVFPLNEVSRCLGTPTYMRTESYFGSYDDIREVIVLFYENRGVAVKVKTPFKAEFIESETLVSLHGIDIFPVKQEEHQSIDQ